ncbi:hypothetical protein [Phyllobacterium zundukense]|uniref:ParA family protein n=1 Tax=Phyllobacterium zundukense TaxID=1867719 RepID=A0A2N9VP71_9HYPH|nr:hypothetical protein [Phyllobacterium zundukense]ATU94912.1 hypothetical protein BLM14_24570 [Phyllobacterium zundukense]PIO41289.1 hypothetical protein B5P45_28250 [Phyllobacterium zundukense]
MLVFDDIRNLTRLFKSINLRSLGNRSYKRWYEHYARQRSQLALAIANLKGGVGKSVLTSLIAAEFAQ